VVPERKVAARKATTALVRSVSAPRALDQLLGGPRRAAITLRCLIDDPSVGCPANTRQTVDQLRVLGRCLAPNPVVDNRRSGTPRGGCKSGRSAQQIERSAGGSHLGRHNCSSYRLPISYPSPVTYPVWAYFPRQSAPLDGSLDCSM
jgi:hypothetical protein